MRYTRLKTTVSKIYDGILDNSEDIHNLLTELREKELTCSMQVKSSPMHEHVRILDVDETKCSWKTLQEGAILRKTSFIKDIQAIEVNVEDEVLMSLKPNPSRFGILDTASDS